MTRHSEPSPFAEKRVRIRDTATHRQYPSFSGGVVAVEDWWDRIAGKSWTMCDGNPGCLIYAMRSVDNRLPLDDEVVYAKLNGMGVLVHVNEIVGEVDTAASTPTSDA